MLVNAIVIPLIRMEIDSLVKWVEECPTPGTQARIFLSIDNEWRDSEKHQLLQVFKNSNLSNLGVHFINCEIDASQSFYERDKAIEAFDTIKYPYGKKSGPNIQFFRSLRKIASQCPDVTSAILLETDAYPIAERWLFDLNQRVHWLGAEIFVAGSKPVLGSTNGTIKNHINGNAIYNIGAKGFSSFLDFWEEVLLLSIKLNPDLAYDVAIEWSYHMSKLLDDKPLSELWNRHEATRLRKGLFDISTYIANISGYSGSGNVMDFLKKYLEQNPKTLIVHGKYLNALGEDIVLAVKNNRLTT